MRRAVQLLILVGMFLALLVPPAFAIGNPDESSSPVGQIAVVDPQILESRVALGGYSDPEEAPSPVSTYSFTQLASPQATR